MRSVLLLFVVTWLGVENLTAASYFVGADAPPSGSGTLEKPWQLEAALTNASTLKAGDTLWLRGGKYVGTLRCRLSSPVPDHPIIIRNYHRERAVMDGQFGFSNNSSNVWVWGVEFIDSQKASRSNPFETIASGGGPGTKFINCLIHDCCNGIASFGLGPYEAYGNILWNVGKSGLEHGFYWQNPGKLPKSIEDNLVGYASGFGIHCYGSAGQLKCLRISGNAVWASGMPIKPKAEILVGGGQPVIDCIIAGNQLYSEGGRGIHLGYATTNNDVLLRENTAYGKPALWIARPFARIVATNNEFVAAGSPCLRFSPDTFASGFHNWNCNRYFSSTATGRSRFADFGTNGLISFDTWKRRTGFDSNSLFTNAPPAEVVVRPNRYEAKRAHLIVWNFGRVRAASADVSKVLTPGDRYEVRNAMDYFAPPTLTGVYDGKPLLIPLTNLAVAPVLFWKPPASVRSISTDFAAFVLIGTGR